MSANVKQVYDNNPTTIVPDTSLIYLGLSPFGISDDSASLFSDTRSSLLNLPVTSSTTIGTIRQDGDVIFQSFGGGNLFFGPSSGNLTLTSAVRNISFGNGNLESLTTGFDNYAFGFATLQNVENGSQNLALAGTALASLVSGNNNIAGGQFCLTLLESGDGNTALGVSALGNLIDGSGNIGIGLNAGSAYTSNESLNICIGTDGVLGENQTMRLGDLTDIFTTYIAGSFVWVPGNLLVGSSHTGNGGESLWVGSSNEIDGDLHFASGQNGDIGANTIACSILSGLSNSVAANSTWSAVLAGQNNVADGIGAVVLTGDSAIADGNYLISGFTANAAGNNSLILGRGTLSGSEAVILTDQDSAYTLTSKDQQFVARFTAGCDFNGVTISSAGDIILPSAAEITLDGGEINFIGPSGTDNIVVPTNQVDAFSIIDTVGNTFFTAVSTTATPHTLLTQTVQMAAGQINNVTEISGATYTALYEDYILACNYFAGSVSITLPASPELGRTYWIKDITGLAATNNITLIGTIDGLSNYVINTNWGSVGVIWTGAQWGLF